MADESQSKSQVEAQADASIDPSKLVPIPQPPTLDAAHLYGLLGNTPDLDPSFQAASVWRLHQLYGDIFQLDLLKRRLIVISAWKYADEVMNDEGWEKHISGNLVEVRAGLGDGLFTSYPTEPNWGKAHRLLMPVFGPLGVRKMFPKMLDIASQLVTKWDRLPAGEAIDTADNFTRLAFDTISYCSFDYRFNNFYRDSMHPFAQQMADFLIESGKRGLRSNIETKLRVWTAQTYQENISNMHKLCDKIVAERKAHPKPEINDLLNTMLSAADPQTGEKLSDENIRFQLVTFLVAGHETTSGTLSYLFYQFCKNPHTLLKAQQEVDEVVGDSLIEIKHLAQLKYIDAAIKETLRVTSPIGLNSRHPKKDTVIGGKYLIKTTDTVNTNLKGLHHDPEIWGDDASEFKPERMLDMSKIPSNAWKPFGVGMRACIGRTFAEQEMLLTVAMILQNFNVDMANHSYELIHKATLTIKPKDMEIVVTRRPNRKTLLVGGGVAAAAQTEKSEKHHAASTTQGAKSKMLILYGTNAGTCKSFAEDLQTQAPEHGFDATVKRLDEAVQDLPKKTPIVVIVPSYEGQPPDNARKFVSWLQLNEKNATALKDVNFALFGVGNSEWAQTFHRVPLLINDLMGKQGATSVCKAGFADVKKDCTSDWEAWEETLWDSLRGSAGETEHRSELKASIVKADALPVLGGDDITTGIVREARSFGGTEVGPEKRDLSIELPPGVVYETGDYLVVLPQNHPDTVKRALNRFELHADDVINITGTRKAYLQSQSNLSATELLSTRVELNAPATQRQLQALLFYAQTPTEKTAVQKLADESNFHSLVTSKNYTLLDILDDHPTIHLPLASYLDSLRPLTPRQYSISSSTLAQSLGGNSTNLEPHPHSTPDSHHELPRFTASITYDVLRAPARSSPSTRTFQGAASTYLASLTPGARLHCYVRKTGTNFHLPSDSLTPIIMIAAGSGIAPMRGFIQDRVAIKKAGAKELGPAVLYFGCRDWQFDDVYRQELDEAERLGAVVVKRAYSKRAPEGGKVGYVNEKIWEERAEFRGMFRAGAKIFLCGSAARLAKSVRETLVKAYLDLIEGSTQEQAEAWFEKNKETRYVTDVFD